MNESSQTSAPLGQPGAAPLNSGPLDADPQNAGLQNAGAVPGGVRLRANKLGVVAIAFFAIAAAAPMAAVVGASPVIFSASGPGTPVIYVIAALLVALFSVGYLRMSQHITNAGGFVAYIAKGLGNKWATGGAGIAILTYLSLQIGLWSQFGVFAQQLIESLTGLGLPVYFWIVVVMAITTVLTMKGVDASLKVLGVLILGETLVVAALVISLVAQKGLGIFTLAGFTGESIFGPGLGISLLFAFACFTSFEATVVFAEEAKEPRRTIPRAAYLVIAFIGVFYMVSTWAISGAVGIDGIQAVATENPSGMIFELAESSAGAWLSIAMQVLVVTSFIAMLLGLSNMFSRYLFALGRAGALPAKLSSVSATGAPSFAGLVNSLAVLAVISAFLLAGADPIATVFAWFVALGTAGFISILLLTSAAVLVYFARSGTRDNLWVTVIAPALSFLAFVVVGYLTLENYDVLLGGAGGVARWLLLGIPLIFLAGLIRGNQKPAINYAAEIL
ncbi:APC family permease [Paenarthrobacter aurescens]|nr:APC family permease [Paenarthrobacter aurescens]MDO6145137.1 APC family permease [Paenarthrobacter aurescens]MDO6148982.1 APC family permease [Paenarthrobacter aurescens]MDO6160228.1 APC family permease [Paenarthrobacter aurescens]MDO6164087.1 APC family permease [Paenarthrobacter aurescens]